MSRDLMTSSQMLADIGLKPRRVTIMTPRCETCYHWFKATAATWNTPAEWKCGHIKCGSFLQPRQGHEELWCPHWAFGCGVIPDRREEA